MLNLSRPSSVRSILFSFAALLVGATAHAQVPISALDRQLSRIDFAVSGVGQFSGTVSGSDYLNRPVSLRQSNTLGALVTLRYIKSPLVGFEGNYGYARYTENFSNIGGVQTKASEYTFGYVAHAPTLFGVQPFASVGAGTIGFSPTPGGGQGLNTQARAAYYYSLGAENQIFASHFGLRAQFRQVFFLAPDFGQNYLTIKQRTSTFEPGVGVFVRF